MLPKTVTRNAPTSMIYNTGDYPYNHGYASYGSGEIYREVVTCGAIIKGNRKAPNAWSYDILRVNRAMSHGYKSSSARWSDGWNAEEGHPNWKTCAISWQLTQPSTANLPDLTATRDRLIDLATFEALTKLWEKVRGSLDLSVDSFEAKKTLQMVNLFPRFKSALVRMPGERVSMRRGEPLKHLGNAWLEWMYGWLPLASSIHGIAEELTRYELNKVQRYKAKHTASEDSYVTVNWSMLNGTFTTKAKCTVQAKVTFGCAFELDDVWLKRCTSMNPLSIGWELMPYSFVVDWFYDVGSYLRDFESALLYAKQFRGGYRSTLSVTRASASGSHSALSVYGEPMVDVLGLSEEEYIRFRRVVLDVVPFPKAPVLKVDLGSDRLLSAAALLNTLIRW